MIRRAEHDDVESVVRLHYLTREIWMPYLPVLHSVEELLGYFSSVVFRDCTVMVAEREGSIVGYCAFREKWVDHLYVHPEHQSVGVGAALIKQAMDSHDDLQLWVFQKNVRAIRFYERLGFTLLRRTDGRDNEEREPDALYHWARRR